MKDLAPAHATLFSTFNFSIYFIAFMMPQCPSVCQYVKGERIAMCLCDGLGAPQLFIRPR